MKKAKYLISSLTALSLLISSAPLTTNAIYTESYGSGRYKDYIELENCSFVPEIWRMPNTPEPRAYIDSTGTKLLTTESLPDIVVFKPAEGVSVDDIKESIRELRSEEGLAYSVTKYFIDEYKITAGTEYFKDITGNDARMLCNVLKEKELVSDLIFMYDRVSEEYWDTPYLTGYYDLYGEREIIEDYISQNDIDLKITDNFSDIKLLADDYLEGVEYPDYYDASAVFYVYPPNGFGSLSAQIEVAEMIAADTGIKPRWIAPCVAGPDGSDDIDVLGSLPGDANCDGIVKMNDAVLIMQTITNPDKYSLTPQGSFNGDLENPGDGITPLDAAAVQKMLLGLPY